MPIALIPFSMPAPAEIPSHIIDALRAMDPDEAVAELQDQGLSQAEARDIIAQLRQEAGVTAELANTAVLDGVDVTSEISVVQLQNRPTLQPSAAGEDVFNHRASFFFCAQNDPVTDRWLRFVRSCLTPRIPPFARKNSSLHPMCRRG